MSALHFDNRTLAELPGDPSSEPGRRQVHGAAWSRVAPTPVADPELLVLSEPLAARLGLDPDAVREPGFVQVLAGNRLLPGMDPWADAYGGHQFGHWAGQLGDGRAISLGEALGADGGRWQLQLKGAGPTPYSRQGDGRAVLRSSIREFLCSEAMHHLGIPTTRALSLVATGDRVLRDMFYDGRAAYEPGAIVCRVSPTFLRFGTFELPASRGDVELLGRLVDFCIDRDHPEIDATASTTDRRLAWFTGIAADTGRLIAQWMRVGFVHGVMNTDNLSTRGLTLDYGPYGWLDDYDPDFTPNTTDAHGRRYRFANQPGVGEWNLGALAGALRALDLPEADLRGALEHYAHVFGDAQSAHMARKLGVDPATWTAGDAALASDLLDLMRTIELDFTLTFRGLGGLDPAAPDPDLLVPAAYWPDRFERHRPAVQSWLDRYAARVRGVDPDRRAERMAAANPNFILRNYLVQQAIDRAERGDLSGVTELLHALREPYGPQTGREHLLTRRPEWARTAPGCSMLSCSS